MLVFKSPFDYVWESFPNAGFDSKNFPLEGKGLNPVLENLWIIIHPPILFIGYAAVAIPFVFAIAGLFKKDYTNWITLSAPWVLFASIALGTGIILGGLWAYETLGWGGFWGWDPVENSSFLPWLGMTALMHTILVFKRTGGLIKSNIFIAILSFILVLYASFLTRSGILGNMSVHSFTDPGAAVYSLLLGMLIIFSLVGFYAYLLRKNEIKVTKINFNLLSREAVIAYGVIVICSIIFIVFAGTSLPIFSDLFAAKSSVEPSFYDNWGIPLISLILITNALSLYLPWKEKIKPNGIKKIIIVLIMSVLITSFFSIIIPKYLSYYLLIFASSFSLIANIEIIIRGNLKNFGGNFSHLGISIFLFGLILLNSLSVSKTITFKYNTPIQEMGFKMTLTDKIEIEKNKPDRQKFIYRINVENKNGNFFADPVVYWSDFNLRKAPIIEPFVKRDLLSDLYVVLKSSQTKGTINSFGLLKGQVAKINNDTNLKISFSAFDMGHSGATAKMAKIGIFVNLKSKDLEYTDTLYTNLIEGSIKSELSWKKIQNSNTDIALIKIIPNKEDISKSEAVLMAKPSDKSYEEAVGEELFVEFSTKPGINLIWIGFLMIVLGTVIANFTSIKKKR